ncbi:MAG: HPr family phosphocarrier protein [Planctomycetota bacterium]
MSDGNEMLVREVRVLNQQGLHARPIMRFVDLVTRFSSEVRVGKGEGTEQVDGRSAMGMMLLEAPQGTALRILARGADASALLDALEELIHSRFGEDP